MIESLLIFYQFHFQSLYLYLVLLYHYFCPAKYRRVIFDDSVNKLLIQTCKEIVKRYKINIIELVTDGDHVHFFDTVSSNAVSNTNYKNN